MSVRGQHVLFEGSRVANITLDIDRAKIPRRDLKEGGNGGGAHGYLNCTRARVGAWHLSNRTDERAGAPPIRRISLHRVSPPTDLARGL